MWSVAVVPESTNHTNSSHGLPLNMLDVTASQITFSSTTLGVPWVVC